MVDHLRTALTASTTKFLTLAGLATVLTTWLLPQSNLLLIACLLTAAIFAAIAVTRQPQAVYWVMLVALPLEATFVLEAGFSILPCYLLLGLQLLLLLVMRQPLRFDAAPVRIYLVYFLITTLSLLFAFFVTPPHADISAAMALRASGLRPFIQVALLALNVCFFALVLQYNPDERTALKSLQVYLAVAAVLTLLGCWQSLAVPLDLPGKDFTQAFGAAADQAYLYGETRYYSALVTDFAPRATFRESLHFSHFLVSILPLALTLFVYRRELPERWRLRGVPLLASLGLAALFLTMSRSGWIAMLAAILFVAVFSPKRRVMKYTALAVLALVGVGSVMTAVGFFRFDLNVWELVSIRLDAARLESDPRVTYLAALWSTFKEYPLLGVGIGNYGAFGAAAVGVPTLLSAHSIFLSALVETGVLGFLASSALIVHFFVKLLQGIAGARGQAIYPYLVGVGGGVLGMTLQYFSFGDRPSFYFLFMLAIGYALLKVAAKKRVASTALAP